MTANCLEKRKWNFFVTSLFYIFSEVFKELVYPLGGKASEGRWKVCAHDGNEADDSKKNNMECVDFYVGDLAASESEAEPDLLNLEDNPNSVEHFVKLEFDEDMRRDFRPGVPYSGKVKYSKIFL